MLQPTVVTPLPIVATLQQIATTFPMTEVVANLLQQPQRPVATSAPLALSATVVEVVADHSAPWVEEATLAEDGKWERLKVNGERLKDNGER